MLSEKRESRKLRVGNRFIIMGTVRKDKSEVKYGNEIVSKNMNYLLIP